MGPGSDQSYLVARVDRLERELRRARRRTTLAAVGGALLVLAAWQLPQSGHVRVRSIIVEDSLGRPRIVIGAPLPLERPDTLAGAGIAILSEAGRLRVALGDPTPAPQVGGRVVPRMGGSAGLVIADSAGDERGGMGTFDDGRANVCLDYAAGRKEAACMFVFPDDQFAGLLVNGPAADGREQAGMVVGRELAQIKVATPTGYERAILRVPGTGMAELLVSDTADGGFVDVLPAIRGD